MIYKSIVYKIKKDVLNVGIYFTAALIPMLINLLINPLIALNMDPNDYAIVGYYSSFNSLIAPLITFYAFNYYTKRYFELDNNERLKLRSTILQTLVFFSFILALLSLMSIYSYMHFFNRESAMPFLPYAFLSVFTLPLTGIITLKLTDYKMQKKSKLFFKLSVSRGLIIALLSLLLVVVLKYGALGKMSARFWGTLILFVFFFYQDFDLIKRNFDWKIFKSMTQFVWPLILGAMLNFFTVGYDKVYLERLGNSNELGFYVVAVQMVSYIKVFRTAISNTFQPDIYKAIISKNWKNASKYMGVILIGNLVIVLVFIVLAPYIIDILTAGRYTYSTKYARILAYSQLSATMYYMVTQISIVLGYTGIVLITKIVGVIFTIALYSFFISEWQFIGAAWGQVASYIVLTVLGIIVLLYWDMKVRNKRKVYNN